MPCSSITRSSAASHVQALRALEIDRLITMQPASRSLLAKLKRAGVQVLEVKHEARPRLWPFGLQDPADPSR